ncbi:hypothetical protein LL037_23830 [Clostridium estertheticum]|uniref:HEPN domain-containing protein n=1 Tax=Clostridium estertheticum TaxID=238834 RepID=UPI001C0D8DB1|nr:HEPN domain-containing protein [Clostridium estertheticum]MBU3199496.1 hypothetical protein [Clostridium estertheticum]WAG65426.1 hypothetical protein LL037_23830 [Clostridium estertheticum]
MKTKIKTIIDKNYKEVPKEEYFRSFFKANNMEENTTVETNIQIQNMNVSGEQDILNFWKSEPNLYYNLSFETVLNSFGGYYDPSKISKREIVSTIMKGLERKLEEGKQIYGYNIQLFNISKINQKIKIGDFEIINKNEFLNLFESDVAKKWRGKNTSDDTVFWSCTLPVSEKYRGLELVEKYIELFINTIRVLYMVTDPKESINFFNGNEQSYRDITIINESGIATGPSKVDKRFKIVNLQDKRFKEFDPIWDKLFRINTENNEIFKRIQTSLMWLGESMEENRTEQAFVKAIFSLEGIIGKKNSGGIAESLSTNVAVILCSDYESRMKMKKKVKRLYSVRSKAVHGESMICSLQEYLDVCQIVRNIIFKFINDPEFNKFDKFDQIEQKINKTLFS